MSGMFIVRYPFASGLVVEDVGDQGGNIIDVECYLAGVTVQDVIDQGGYVVDVEGLVKLGNVAHDNELAFSMADGLQSICVSRVVVKLQVIGARCQIGWQLDCAVDGAALYKAVLVDIHRTAAGDA